MEKSLCPQKAGHLFPECIVPDIVKMNPGRYAGTTCQGAEKDCLLCTESLPRLQDRGSVVGIFCQLCTEFIRDFVPDKIKNSPGLILKLRKILGQLTRFGDDVGMIRVDERCGLEKQVRIQIMSSVVRNFVIINS